MKHILFAYLLLIGHIVSAQTSVFNDASEKSQFDVAILNYTDLSSIEKFKKLEIGINLEGEIESRIRAFINPNNSSNNRTKPLNPFLEWSLDIEVTFTHPETSKSQKRDFFYYHEYEQKNNSWNDSANMKNNYLMRARFAPSQPGIWKADVVIQLDGIRTSLPTFQFNVSDNNHPGYVKIHENKKNLQLGNDIIFPLGHVFPGPYNRAKGKKTPWGDPPQIDQSKNTTVADWNQFIGDISDYIKQGGKYFKLVQTAYGNLIEFEEKGNYTKRLHYAWEQDKILDMCEENNVLINFNLLFQDVFMAYGQNGDGFHGDPYDYGNYAPDMTINENDYYPTYCYFEKGTLPSNMFLKDELMKFHKQRTRYYLSRYGYSPQIYTWELMSELLHMDQFNHGTIDLIDPKTGEKMINTPAEHIEHPGHETAIKAIKKYHDEISSYIRNDLNDQDHLLTIDIASINPVINEYIVECASNPLIDIIGYNLYSNRADKLIIGKQDKNGKNNTNNYFGAGSDNETSEYKQIFEQFLRYQKPIIVSEAGHSSGSFGANCYGKIGNTIDVATYGYTGIAALHPWEGYVYGDPGEFDQRKLWQATIQSEKHMNSPAVLKTLNNKNGSWLQGRQAEKVDSKDAEYAKELQYYLSEDKTLATGYVRNRTYNVHTKRINDACLADESQQSFGVPNNQLTSIHHNDGNRLFFNNNLYVTGLQKNTDYKVTWYEFLSDKVIQANDDVSTDGKSRLLLEHPELTVDNPTRPILWFKIEKKP